MLVAVYTAVYTAVYAADYTAVDTAVYTAVYTAVILCSTAPSHSAATHSNFAIPLKTKPMPVSFQQIVVGCSFFRPCATPRWETL